MRRLARGTAALGVALLVSALAIPAASAEPTTDPPSTLSTTATTIPADADPPATPAITVTPSTDLVSGDSVAVHGTGFPAGETGIVQCRTGVASLQDCDLGGTVFIDATTDGTFDATFPVHREIRITSGSIVQCADAPDACAIAAGNIANQAIGAAVPISFDPDASGPSPTITVTPDTGLVDGQSVGITGSGFIPGAFLLVAQCATDGESGCINFGAPVTVAPGGTFVTTYTVRNRVSGANGPVSCLDTVCRIQVDDIRDSEFRVSVPLAFDPNGPRPPIPSITVAPNTDLVDRQTVTITGSDFDPDVDVFVLQCADPDQSCAPTFQGVGHTNESGAVSIDVRVRRNVGQFGPTGVERVDSALSPCHVSASQNDGITASASVAFDPDVPAAPPPTYTATPTTDLTARQQVSVQGHGFTPGSYVSVSQCGTSADGSFGTCTGGVSVPADASGDVAATIVVRRLLVADSDEDPIDCASAAGACELQVYNEDLIDADPIPLTFDPNAPMPPAPSVTIDPSTDLGYRQSVALHAEGFATGDTVFVQQCGVIPDEPFPSPCTGAFTPVVENDGSIDMPFTVHRTLTDGFADPVDCAAAPGTCVVTVTSSDGSDRAQALLSFDPDAPIPPPPSVTVTPATGLADGQLVDVAGGGFSPGASIGYTLCADSTLSLNRCAISNAKFAVADATGSFTGQLPVTSVITTPNGTIDCGAAPGTCFIGAADTSDFTDNGRAPVSFGPEISIQGASVREANGGAVAGLTVTLSRPSDREVRVHYSSADDSAVAPSDYLAGSFDIVFAPGETSKVIPFGVVGDPTREPDEQFFVSLSDPRGGSIAAGHDRATVKISDPVVDDHHDHDHSHHHHGRPWWDHGWPWSHGGHHDSGHRYCNRF